MSEWQQKLLATCCFCCYVQSNSCIYWADTQTQGCNKQISVQNHVFQIALQIGLNMQKSNHPKRHIWHEFSRDAGRVMAHENVYPPSLHLDIFSLSSQPGIYFPLGTFFFKSCHFHRVMFGICGAAVCSFKISYVEREAEPWPLRKSSNVFVFLSLSGSKPSAWLAGCLPTENTTHYLHWPFTIYSVCGEPSSVQCISLASRLYENVLK